MNMFAMGHGLHSAVRQEVRKFLYVGSTAWPTSFRRSFGNGRQRR